MSNPKFKIRKGDQVVVIAGKDKGKKGEVLKVIPSEARVVVAGINNVKRHTKPTRTSQGGIVTKEASIHISNVQLLDPKTNKGVRVGFKLLADGKKVRVSKKSGEVIGG